MLLTPEWVTTANMNSTIVKDKFVPVTQLCSGNYAADCKAAGITPRVPSCTGWTEPAGRAAGDDRVIGDQPPGRLLQLQGISKSFGAVRALDRVDLESPRAR